MRVNLVVPPKILSFGAHEFIFDPFLTKSGVSRVLDGKSNILRIFCLVHHCAQESPPSSRAGILLYLPQSYKQL